eukprot:6134317-Pleurochrysis_carterae.AAC.1
MSLNLSCACCTKLLIREENQSIVVRYKTFFGCYRPGEGSVDRLAQSVQASHTSEVSPRSALASASHLQPFAT